MTCNDDMAGNSREKLQESQESLPHIIPVAAYLCHVSRLPLASCLLPLASCSPSFSRILARIPKLAWHWYLGAHASEANAMAF
jgi:hypothetical protein